MDHLKKLLGIYFKFASKCVVDVKEALKTAENPSHSCCNLTKILKSVIKDQEEKKSKLAYVRQFHSKLIENISYEISKEVFLLKKIKDSIRKVIEEVKLRYEELDKKFVKAVKNNSSALCLEPFINKAEDCFRFFYSVYLQFSQILGFLDPRDGESFHKLSKLSKIDFKTVQIIAATQLLKLSLL